MLRHADIWQAIDRLAAEHGFSPSGLARRAGLDPTTFNKSKRLARDGRPRWPSTESLAKILEAVGTSPASFIAYFDQANGAGSTVRRVPVISLAQAAIAGFFDAAGYPAGTMWDELLFPEIDDPHAYALVIGGDALAPIYRDGDTIILSPAAGLRRGDRVVVRLATGEVTIRQMIRRGARKLELAPLAAPEPEEALEADAVAFVHRIVWASQ